MALVSGVAVPIMDVIDVVAMSYSVVAATGFVCVAVVTVGYVRQRVLVIVALVRGVRVTVMDIVGMSVMLDTGVPAARAVLMPVLGVDFVDIGTHRSSPLALPTRDRPVAALFSTLGPAPSGIRQTALRRAQQVATDWNRNLRVAAVPGRPDLHGRVQVTSYAALAARSEDLDPEADAVHKWRVMQLTRLGLSTPVADAVADRVDWHEVAKLVRRGCPAALALAIVE